MWISVNTDITIHTHTHTHTHSDSTYSYTYQLNNQWNQFITYHFYQATKLTCVGSSKDSYTSPEQPWSFPASLSMANRCSFQVSLSAHFPSLQYKCQMMKWYWHYMSSSKFCCQTISCRNRPCWSSPIIRIQGKLLHIYYTLGKLTLHSRKSIPIEKTHMLIPPILQSHQHHHQ